MRTVILTRFLIKQCVSMDFSWLLGDFLWFLVLMVCTHPLICSDCNCNNKWCRHNILLLSTFLCICSSVCGGCVVATGVPSRGWPAGSGALLWCLKRTEGVLVCFSLFNGCHLNIMGKTSTSRSTYMVGWVGLALAQQWVQLWPGGSAPLAASPQCTVAR